MAGLLGQGWDDPQSNAIMQLAGGLLGGNFAQGAAAYGNTMAGAKDAAMKRQFLQSQMDENNAVVEQKRAQTAEAQRIRSLVANFGVPALGSGATGQANDALPAELRMGAQPQIAASAPDYTSLIRQGVPVEIVKSLAESANFGRPKVARTADIEGPNGTKMIQGYDDYGMPVGQGASGYVAPQLINQGDRQTFAKPMAGASFGVNMSASERDSSARGWAGVQNSRERLAFDKAGGAGGVGGFGKAPAGYRWKPDGALEAIPGGPGEKLPESQQKQVVGVNNLSNAITEYRAQLKNFKGMDTLSMDARAGMGTKYNNMMLQAKEAYNLGVLNGPDLDILTSVITDPRSIKGAFTSNKAMDLQASELDRIMQGVGKVSGQPRQPQGGATGKWDNSAEAPAVKPKAPQSFDAKPPAQQFKGKFVTSPDGKRFQSDGMIWKEVK